MMMTTLTLAALALNAAIDSGKYADLTVDEIRPAIDDGTVLEFLARRLGEDLWVEPFRAEYRAADCRELAEEWARMSNAIEASRIGVERNGLCLLLAFTIQGIQVRVLEEPEVDPADPADWHAPSTGNGRTSDG